MRANSSGEQRPTILAIEAQSDLRDVYAHFLGEAGFEFLGVASHQEAREALAERSFDVILAEILPDRAQSFDFARELLARKGRFALIWVGNLPQSQLQSAYEARVEAVFPKPFRFEALVHIVRTILAANEVATIRRPVRLSGAIACDIHSPNETIETLVANFHHEGMYVAWPHGQMPASGARWSFTLKPPASEAALFQGVLEVRWTQETPSRGFGARIINMIPQEAFRLTQWVNRIKVEGDRL